MFRARSCTRISQGASTWRSPYQGLGVPFKKIVTQVRASSRSSASAASYLPRDSKAVGPRGFLRDHVALIPLTSARFIFLQPGQIEFAARANAAWVPLSRNSKPPSPFPLVIARNHRADTMVPRLCVRRRYKNKSVGQMTNITPCPMIPDNSRGRILITCFT